MKELPIIGVTGASGAGKSAVCKILTRMGAYVIDTDKIAHEVILKPKPAYCEIIDEFRDDLGFLLDSKGEIIRRRLAELVFPNETKLKRLTEITHKYIVKQAFDIAVEEQSHRRCKFIVIDAPLLIEAGMHVNCQKVIGVIASEALRIERIIKRDGLPDEQAKIRAKKQTPLCILLQHADIIIENNGDFAELERQVLALNIV